MATKMDGGDVLLEEEDDDEIPTLIPVVSELGESRSVPVTIITGYLGEYTGYLGEYTGYLGEYTGRSRSGLSCLLFC